MSILNVRVAPPVRKTEIYNNHAAKAAMQKEWDRLLSKYVWDEEHPREWHEVCDAARRGGVGGGRVYCSHGTPLIVFVEFA